MQIIERKPIPKGSTRSKSVIPRWVKAVPMSPSHGSGELQKRLWRLTSDCVRIRDFSRYAECVATGERIYDWRAGDAGHYKPYSKCNGLFKFDLRNIHLQKSQSNAFGGAEDGAHFKETLVKRYGAKIIDIIEKENRASSLKFSNLDIIALMKDRIDILSMYDDKPDYYDRVVSLMHERS